MSGRPMAVLASLAETMPEEIATRLMGQGIVPLCGMGAALEAIGAMSRRQVATEPAAPPRVACAGEMVAEAAAKARLADHGLRVPVSREVTRGEIAEAAGVVGFPLVLKAVGLAHKSDAGGVALGLGSADAVVRAAEAMPGTDFLLEEMVAGAVVELLVGVVNDPAHGLLLTLGRGGVETELQHDVAHALLPVSRADVGGLLDRLRAAPLLGGFRGRAAADVEAVIDAVMAVQAFVLSAPGVREVEINPLLALPQGAVAVDALIREEMP
ncbi:acetate--CoA ligase family protein [Roseobacteraceae bacterium S113]